MDGTTAHPPAPAGSTDDTTTAIRSIHLMGSGDLTELEAVHTADAVNRESKNEPPDTRGTEVVALTTTGRRSGQPRAVMILTLPDGDDLLVAASHGGVDREPPWWLNLQADPHAQVAFRGESFDVVAEEVGDDERAASWARLVAVWPAFSDYQAKVRRRIALVRLRRHHPFPDQASGEVEALPGTPGASPRPLLAGLIDLADPGRPPHHGGRPCGALCVPACTRGPGEPSP